MLVDIEHNLDDHDLITVLAALALESGVEDRLTKSLEHSSDREEAPERYMKHLMTAYVHAGVELDRAVYGNVDRYLANVVGYSLRKSKHRPAPHLTQGQLEELIALIRVHYRGAIRVSTARWTADPRQEATWKRMGIIAPDVQMGGLLRDAFIAGRLAEVLNDGASLADMRRMAATVPVPREAQLSLDAMQDRVRFDLAGGPGYRMEQQAGQLILNQNARQVQQIMVKYQRKELRATPTNRDGLMPHEMDALETDRAVQGWRGVARELRNRMATIDRNRDWERVAASSIRQAHSIGAVGAMIEDGVDELYYHVQTNACQHCKRMYLNTDGTPKFFKVTDIMSNITATGGANYGRTASRIGDPHLGWLPNALLHPWCQCRPRRRVAGMA